MEFPLRVGIFSTGHIKQKDNNFEFFGDQAISIKTQENIDGNKATRLFPSMFVHKGTKGSDYHGKDYCSSTSAREISEGLHDFS